MGNKQSGFMGLRATAGAVLYFMDQDTGKVMAPMIVRGEKYRKQHRDHMGKETLLGTYSFPGGHIDVEEKETLAEAVLREVSEELSAADGGKVLHNLETSSLGYPIACGINYGRWHHKADWQAGTAWYGYMYELSKEQFAAVQKHAGLMATDENYAKRVKQHSSQEIGDVKLIALDELITAVESGHIRIGYDYELEYAKVALRNLQPYQKEWQNRVQKPPFPHERKSFSYCNSM